MFTKPTSRLVRFALAVLVALIILAARMAFAQEPAPSPEATVDAFYRWYLGYDQLGIENERQSPPFRVDYHDSPLLTEGFMAEIDDVIASFETSAGYDPFLQAQDIPLSLFVEEARIAEDGLTAEVVVRTSFTEHAFTVELALIDEAWLIDGITPGEIRTPEGVARRFFDWYLGYHLWDGQTARPNALVDGAYQNSPLLTGAFKQQVAELVASFERGGYDPFLCAQDLPNFVLPGPAEMREGSAHLAVKTSFEGHSFAVVLDEVDGQWLVSDIICAAPDTAE